MKQRLIQSLTFLFLFLFIVSCTQEKHDLLKKNKEKLHKIEEKLLNSQKQLSEYKKIEKIQNILNGLIPKYAPIQKVIELTPSRRAGNYNRFCLSDPSFNNFKTSNNIINVEIPITVKELKIIDVINVSSSRVNAILILLDGHSGQETPETPVQSFIEAKIEINKINGLNEKRLNKHKKLKVIILHDDEYYKKHHIYNLFFKICTLFQGYGQIGCIDQTCDLRNHFPEFSDSEYEKFKPKEEGGGVITGD